MTSLASLLHRLNVFILFVYVLVKIFVSSFRKHFFITFNNLLFFWQSNEFFLPGRILLVACTSFTFCLSQNNFRVILLVCVLCEMNAGCCDTSKRGSIKKREGRGSCVTGIFTDRNLYLPSPGVRRKLNDENGNIMTLRL